MPRLPSFLPSPNREIGSFLASPDIGLGLISKADSPSSSFSLKELSPAQPYETDRPREKKEGRGRLGGQRRAFVREEGKKEGDCLLQPSSSDFPIVFRVVTFVSMVAARPDIRPIWRSGRVERRGRMGSILEGRKWKHAMYSYVIVRVRFDY